MMNKEITIEDFQNAIDRWKQTPLLQLAEHFHRLDEESCFRRVQRYEMNEFDLDLFKACGSVSRIDICLALELENVQEEFNSYIILKLELDNSTEPIYLKLDAKSESSDVQPLGEVVTENFKNTILNNWLQMDMHLIDDLFVANTSKGPERVHSFIIETMIPTINQLDRSKIIGITLYPGVDMNKFVDKTLISFAPVLGFTTDDFTVLPLYHHGVIEANGYELFIEYTRPCPPTCKDL